ncbi:MAG: pseudouridine synthase [Lachnospiraceae bacterium]|jgi:23S rRNA pseudouridine2604 synthase|nr:pseudouridine synthase [Lachnospiraceae bacterium]
MEQDGIRINKYLSDAGVCSRREADRLIEDGAVTVDGQTATLGTRVLPGQKVLVRGKEAVLTKKDDKVVLAFHKPRGVECTSDRSNPDNIIDYIHYNKRIYTVGRLDKNSSGLILLTNDGDLANRIAKAGEGHEKEYLVRVDKPVTAEFLHSMAHGVPVLGRKTAPCKVQQLGECFFRIVLIQGMNRQIRRMCEYLEYKVVALKRVRVMNILLGDLPSGKYREVTPKELEELKKMLAE